MDSLTLISEDQVKEFLSWQWLIPIIEKALADLSKTDDSVIQPPRLVMSLPPKKGVLLSMPGFSRSEDALGCKLVTSFMANKNFNLPSIMANILLFDAGTGKLQAIVEGTEITAWRTAAASAVATKYLHKGPKDVLTILGAGTQARSHIHALQSWFNFKEVRIWNRNIERAQQLRRDLQNIKDLESKNIIKVYENNEDCVKGADVICTTTYATEPILHWSWLKKGVHINAVGGSITHHSELDQETYTNSNIFVDNMDAAKKELKGIFDLGCTISGEVGSVINGTLKTPENDCSVFHSLGMAIEDVLTADYIYKKFIKKYGVLI